jgi:hypothetical protein
MPSATLTIGDVTVLEGNAGTHNAVVPVTLTGTEGDQGNSITVDYNSADGTAKAGSDYKAFSGKLVFACNEKSKSILVPVIGDRLPEADESFFVRLSNAKGARIADSEGVVTIVDDEPRISITDTAAAEGNSGATPFTFTVSLSAAYDVPVTVHYDTADDTAIAGADYVTQSGTVTFQAGQATPQTITVMVKGDRLGEPNKTFSVNLSSPDTYAAISKGAGIGSILDDEPRISIGDAWQDYYGSAITFTVSLAAPYDQVVTVNFTTVDGTALAGQDYLATSGKVTFNPGDTVQTITVQLLALDSADKYFSIQFSNVSANALLMNEWAYGYWYIDYGYYGGDPYSSYPYYYWY